MDRPSSRDTLHDKLTRAGEKGVLRFLTCGSVDDGKSTLIGRLLFDSKLLFDDQMKVLERDSRKHGTAGDDVDFALLLDGLEAEREQGITIDVAYRFFSTKVRKFVVADTPGHEQYTRNMATGASTADVAVVMVDARKGILAQTLRHTHIARMMGIRHIVLAINKMDLVGHDQQQFLRIVEDYQGHAETLGFESVMSIPMSARYGDNVSLPSTVMDWYVGPVLLDYLEQLDVERDASAQPLRMPVQWVNRPNLDFRGYAGTLVSGVVTVGDPITVLPSGKSARINSILVGADTVQTARAGDAVTLVLDRDIDVSRGDVFAAPDDRPEVSDQFSAELLWMHEEGMLPGRSYLLKLGAMTVPATISSIKHAIDVNSQKKLATKTLAMNHIGVCNFSLTRPIVFDSYASNRDMGGFILIDRYTNQTVGAGMVDFALRRASNIHRHAMDVSKEERARIKGQKPTMLWFTGLSGAGKSTIANLVERRLAEAGHHTYSLDGDNVRHGLNRDLGFTDEDRVENIRRIGEVGKLFVDAGLLVMCSFISPFRSERRMVRDLIEEGEFIEVFVDAPLHVCEERDPKGLYRKVKSGGIKNFTGYDSPYDAPVDPELRIDTTRVSAEEAADIVIGKLQELGRLS